MSFQAYPTEAGTYRVKVYKTDKDHYWKYIQDRDRWVKLTTVDETAANPSSLSFIVSKKNVCFVKHTDRIFSSGLFFRLQES